MKKVLFVCLSNVCRSPAAEALLRDQLVSNNMISDIKVDSAGITAQHAGEMTDVRMRNHMESRNLKLDSRARRFRPEEDFANFDYIVAMDHDNLNELKAFDPEGEYSDKLHLLTEYCSNKNQADDVKDPFYGKDSDFESVLNIIDDGVKGLLSVITNDINNKAA